MQPKSSGFQCCGSNLVVLRFAERTKPADDLSPNGMAGCLLWVGAGFGTGGVYGGLCVQGRTRSAHRVAYEMAYGPVPTGLQVDHLCRRKKCVNPEHLEAVTGVINVRRASRAGLTMELAEEIRALQAQGWLQADVAAAYGISEGYASCIKHRKTWA